MSKVSVKGLAANPRKGCKECEILSRRDEGGRGRREGMEEEDKAAKDKARERSQAMALRGRGFRFRRPCPGWPPECFLPPLPTRHHCPFKHYVVTPGPFFPVLQPAQTPPALKAPLPQWTSPATHPPAPLSHLPTPPYRLLSSIFHLYSYPFS